MLCTLQLEPAKICSSTATEPGLSLTFMMSGATSHTGRLRRALDYTKRHANFFRIHLAAFIVVPFIFVRVRRGIDAEADAATRILQGSILYACNGRYPVKYLDSLFLAYSAFCGVGLSTINLSQTTGFQQAVLCLLMLGGHFVRRVLCPRSYVHQLTVRRASSARSWS